MARCDRCGAEVKELTRFCPGCGKPFVPRAEPISVEGEPGAYYCFKHKKDVTRVTCGRCEKPICVKCLVVSSAGVRCKQCASNKIPLRARGVLHDIGSSVGPMDGRKVWYLYIFAWIVRLFTGFFR